MTPLGNVPDGLRASLTLCAAIALLGPAAGAQTVRGVVVGQSDQPVAGVVVTLLDSTSAVAARALSNERGEFRLAASRAGTYRIRTLRIGFRPVTSDPLVLGAGEDVTRRLALTGVALALDTVRVAERASCRVGGDTAAATFAVWEQARAALTAAQLTAGARAIAATTVAYDRTLDRDLRHVRQQTASVSTGFVSQPWRALAPDSLRRVGYVVDDALGFTTYHAPGLDMLVSDAFLGDHCFRLVPAADPASVGITFEPTPERRRVADIRGTLWLDRASSELRRLEFRYANIPRVRAEHAGGDMAFARLRDGGWVVSGWYIRMPALERVDTPDGRPEIRVAEIRVTGGELALATRGRDTLWARPPLVLAGTVVDSATGAGVAGARVALLGTALQGVSDGAGRFAIGGVLPGAYTLEVRTTSLDALGALHRSALAFTDSAATVRVRIPDRAAVFVGAVLADSTRAPIAGAEVTLPGLARTALTNERGAFRFADIPPGAHRVVVRRMSYSPLDAVLAFAAGRTVERQIFLTRVRILDSVIVTAERPLLREFEEHRRLGLGRFLTRADLEQVRGLQMADVFRRFNGVNVVSGGGNRAWISTSRGPRRIADVDPRTCTPPPREGATRLDPAPCVCYPAVYLDGVLSSRDEVPNINRFTPDEIEAIEYYAGPAQTPARYSEMGSACGAVVIHTRRTP